MNTTQVAAKNCRAEFAQGTKAALAAAAGYLCCICLNSTTLAVAKKGKKAKNSAVLRRAGGDGVASHIYGATGSGCPRPSQMSANELKHESNGIWTCATHGRLIDDNEEHYPVDKLQRLKRIREFGHELTHTSLTVKRYFTVIPLEIFNDIVTAFAHDLDHSVSAIEANVESAAIHYLQSKLKLERPATLKMEAQGFPAAALPKAIKHEIEGSDNDAQKIPCNVRAPAKRKTTIQLIDGGALQEIADSWFEEHDYIPNRVNHLHLQDTLLSLMAVNLETHEISKERLDTYGFAAVYVSVGENPQTDRRYQLSARGHGHDELEICWRYNYNIPNFKGSFSRLKSARISLYYPEAFIQQLRAYEAILEKIASGWKPAIQIGLKTPKHGTFHPAVGVITDLPPGDELVEMHRRAKVINFVIDLGIQYQLPLSLSDAAFDKALTAEAIKSACADLAQKSSPVAPRPYRSAPCATGENWEICLIADYRSIRFKQFILQTNASPGYFNR